MLGLLFGGSLRLRPREKLVQIETKIRRHSSSGSANFLNNGVFHGWGLVRSSGVQITGK
jgi:hypothetical protein